MRATRYGDYRRAVLAGLTAYRRRQFAGRDTLFEPGPQGEITFRPEAAHRNFFDPALYHDLVYRPRSFRSMTSSRVLAISVLGTLARRDDLELLAEVRCRDGQPIVSGANAARALVLELEHRAGHLHEGPAGPPDLWLESADLRLAVVPRLLERELGSCPQPARGRCDGNYARANREAYCWYSAQGAPYWQQLPQVLGWSARREHRPCPLRAPFALVRTLLSLAEGGATGTQTLLLICDARNPAFAPPSRTARLLADLQSALRLPITLRQTTWQALATAMAHSPWYSDLLAYLQVKYGIAATEGEDLAHRA